MATRYDYIFFDLDGTLTDPYEGITKSVRHALAHFGIDERDARVLKRFIGPPLVESFQGIYGFTPEQAHEALALYRERFAERGLYENRLIDGIPELLTVLKAAGKKSVLATSKPIVYADKILEHFGIMKYFEFTSGATLDSKRNAKHEVISYALEALGIGPERCVMVGDRRQDVLGAKACGMECIGVRFVDYAEEGELEAAGAAAVVHTPDELTMLLLS